MKKTSVFLLTISIIFCLCACSAQVVEPTEPVTEPTQAPTEATEEVTVPEGLIDEEEFRSLTSYFVTVLDENAAPVVGAMVRLGDNEHTCITDETGVAQFSVEEGTYVVTIEELPLGYEYATDYREFPFEAQDVTLTIQVRQTVSEPIDMGYDDSELPVEELPEEEFVPEG